MRISSGVRPRPCDIALSPWIPRLLVLAEYRCRLDRMRPLHFFACPYRSMSISGRFQSTVQWAVDVLRADEVFIVAFRSLTWCDAMGRYLVILVDQSMAPGRYTTPFDATCFSSRLYLYGVEMDTFQAIWPTLVTH